MQSRRKFLTAVATGLSAFALGKEIGGKDSKKSLPKVQANPETLETAKKESKEVIEPTSVGRNGEQRNQFGETITPEMSKEHNDRLATIDKLEQNQKAVDSQQAALDIRLTKAKQEESQISYLAGGTGLALGSTTALVDLLTSRPSGQKPTIADEIEQSLLGVQQGLFGKKEVLTLLGNVSSAKLHAGPELHPSLQKSLLLTFKFPTSMTKLGSEIPIYLGITNQGQLVCGSNPKNLLAFKSHRDTPTPLEILQHMPKLSADEINLVKDVVTTPIDPVTARSREEQLGKLETSLLTNMKATLTQSPTTSLSTLIKGLLSINDGKDVRAYLELIEGNTTTDKLTNLLKHLSQGLHQEGIIEHRIDSKWLMDEVVVSPRKLHDTLNKFLDYNNPKDLQGFWNHLSDDIQNMSGKAVSHYGNPGHGTYRLKRDFPEAAPETAKVAITNIPLTSTPSEESTVATLIPLGYQIPTTASDSAVQAPLPHDSFIDRLLAESTLARDRLQDNSVTGQDSLHYYELDITGEHDSNISNSSSIDLSAFYSVDPSSAQTTSDSAVQAPTVSPESQLNGDIITASNGDTIITGKTILDYVDFRDLNNQPIIPNLDNYHIRIPAEGGIALVIDRPYDLSTDSSHTNDSNIPTDTNPEAPDMLTRLLDSPIPDLSPNNDLATDPASIHFIDPTNPDGGSDIHGNSDIHGRNDSNIISYHLDLSTDSISSPTSVTSTNLASNAPIETTEAKLTRLENEILGTVSNDQSISSAISYPTNQSKINEMQAYFNLFEASDQGVIELFNRIAGFLTNKEFRNVPSLMTEDRLAEIKNEIEYSNSDMQRLLYLTDWSEFLQKFRTFKINPDKDEAIKLWNCLHNVIKDESVQANRSNQRDQLKEGILSSIWSEDTKEGVLPKTFENLFTEHGEKILDYLTLCVSYPPLSIGDIYHDIFSYIHYQDTITSMTIPTEPIHDSSGPLHTPVKQAYDKFYSTRNLNQAQILWRELANNANRNLV